MKHIKEFFTGWSDDKYCRVCGARLEVWSRPAKADTQTGEILWRKEIKSCTGTIVRHECVLWERYVEVKKERANA